MEEKQVDTGLFRKEAIARFQRTDAPGGVVDIAPPRTIALFGVLAVMLLALFGLGWFGRAPDVAEGRGVVRPDRPSIAMLAPDRGYIAGDDYDRRGIWEHGVTRAVDEFVASGEPQLSVEP